MSSALFQGRTAILLLTTAAAIQSAQTAHNEAKNLAELNAICQLIKLATGGPPNVRPAVVDESAISDIGTFNISLADPEWSIQFPTDAAKTEDDAKNCPANEHQANCKKQWLEWQKSKLRTKVPDSVFKRLPINDAKKSQPQGRAAAQAVAAILAEAQQLKESFEEEHTMSASDLAEAALKDMRKAAFNSDAAPAAANERCNINGGGSRGAACALPTVGQGLCIAALCLCAKGDTQPSQEHCGSSINPTMTAWAATNVKAGYEAVSTACDKALTPPFTAAVLRALLAQIQSRTKTISAAAGSIIAIGTVDTTADCDARTNVACIDLKKASPYDSTAATQQIGWQQHIENAAANIEKANSVAAATAELNRQLKALQTKAEIIYKQLYHSRDEEKSSETSPKTVTEGKAKTEKVCNEAGNDEDKCNDLKDKDCVFNTEAKKCELKKDVKEKLEKGSQEGRDDKKEDKCAGKQQKDCEKATECKWENNACKDSSFLVKKKIDLIASTFASLVAL